MIRTFLVSILFLFSQLNFAQTAAVLPVSNDALTRELETINKNPKISVDSAWSILSTWNQYPDIKSTNRYYLFLYKDSVFGTVPLKVFIPKNYKNNIQSPAVLLLHGATVLSSFKDAYKDTTSDEDFFDNYFAEQNFIIIRPFADSYGPHADGTKNFDWVINRFNVMKKSRYLTNPTFNTLTAIISQLKQLINIDDNKLFACGHSDGADGVFSFQVYKPSPFAGFLVYNSMLTHLGAYNIYLRNTQNRPLYLVHSNLDDLRPIQETRTIVRILDSIKSPVLYKEYLGYKHYDKHLFFDLPYGVQWIKGISRNTFQKTLSWEFSDSAYNTCDWLRILKTDTTMKNAAWHTELNSKAYNKRDKVYMNEPKYDLNKSAAVNASFNNNRFNITVSRIKEIKILISPVMVNLKNVVYVNVNGKQVYKGKVIADKTFLINHFKSTYDRQALWVTSIKLKI